MLGNIASALVGLFIASIYNENKEIERKQNDAFNSFNHRKDEFIYSFQKQLESDFPKNINFCKDEINSNNENFNLELDKYINKITEIENSDNLFNLRVNNYLEKLSGKMSKLEVNHLNILLVGPTGVGKSCLINSILKLENNNKAETQITKPTTKIFKTYESNKIPNIRLIDSRGLEKGNYNVEALVKEITNYIEDQELKGNPDNYIHCIWYCITGTIFEDIEEETLLKLSSIYDDSKLPIIVVYTQAIIPAYYDAINKEINKIKQNIEYLPVLAQDMKLSDGTLIKSYNLDLLLYKSLEKSKNAVYSSVFSAIRKIVKNEIDLQIDTNINTIKNNINKRIIKNSISKIILMKKIFLMKYLKLFYLKKNLKKI